LTQPQSAVGSVGYFGERISGLGEGVAHSLQDMDWQMGQDRRGF
jgi:hypothetical protein